MQVLDNMTNFSNVPTSIYNKKIVEVEEKLEKEKTVNEFLKE